MSGIDKSTGLPEGMSNRTPLLDKMRAVAESAELALRELIPLTEIESILLKPINAREILAGKSIDIRMSGLPGFDQNLSNLLQSMDMVQ